MNPRRLGDAPLRRFHVNLTDVISLNPDGLLITEGMVQSLNFLLWIGLVILILSVISFLLRSMKGRQ